VIVDRLRAAGCVYAEEEEALLEEAASSAEELEALVSQREAGLPLEPLLGWAVFCGARIVVRPGVFVPRRRTELLVAEARALLAPGAVVVDLCCGSGAVGAALLAGPAPIELYLSDIDDDAARCAVINVGSDAVVLTGDLFDPLPRALHGRVDVLVANAPYVPTAAIALMPPEARLHEARVALDGGDDGLDVQRRVIGDAAHWLSPTGTLLVETSARQARATAGLFRAAGLAPRVIRSKELDATVVAGALA
jgi:release factor glutamine methyltransferase